MIKNPMPKKFILLINLLLIFPSIAFCNQNTPTPLGISTPLDNLSKQRLAVEFTSDAALAIKYCREADDLFVNALLAFTDSKKSASDCLSDLYQAKEKFIDAKRIVERWENKGQISEIVDEIGELKQGVDDISCCCDVWTAVLKNSNLQHDISLTSFIKR